MVGAVPVAIDEINLAGPDEDDDEAASADTAGVVQVASQVNEMQIIISMLLVVLRLSWLEATCWLSSFNFDVYLPVLSILNLLLRLRMAASSLRGPQPATFVVVVVRLIPVSLHCDLAN